ncbi:Arc family DNA-binding protein [Limimaricola cinnabarinus]|uniref:Arc family DNA-binding protein n=1 Tax=Limimaricola cinnabarinus TaxID=1125964 RepID=UPI002FE4221D
MSQKPYPSTVQDKFVLRLPDGMRERIKAEADKNGRSMNSEVVARLETSFAGDGADADRRPLEERVDKLEQKAEDADLNVRVFSNYVMRELEELKQRILERG